MVLSSGKAPQTKDKKRDKRLKKMHSKKLHNVYPPADIMRLIKSRRIK
jgi:hypothetical protein